jgi:hypothetical protein
MHQEFENLYQQLYVGWPYTTALQPVFDRLRIGQMRDIVEDVRKAIDEAEATQSAKLRTDAKYFLLLNFVDMVLLPISIVREKRFNEPGSNIISEEKMRSDLAHDVREIINEAVRKKNDEVAELPWSERNKPEHKEISGHNVIDAIGNIWNEMKFNDYLYWAG